MLGLANRMSLSLGGANNGGGVAIASRYFTQLSSAGSKHYTIPEVTLSGDFEVSATVYHTSATTEVVLGRLGFNTNFLAVTDLGAVRLNIGGVTLNSANGLVALNKLYTIKAVRIGTAVEIFLDDVSVGTTTTSNTWILDLIGAYQGPTLFWSGIIYNVDISGTGIDRRYYKIDETWADNLVLRNSATTLGAEDVTNGDFATDSDWTKGDGWTISGGTANHNGAFGLLTQEIGATTGETYLVSALVDLTSGGSVQIGVGNATTTLVDGLNTVTVVAIGSDVQIGAGSFVGSVDLVSVKLATGYGTAVNITDADADQFTKSGADWLGVEQVVNGNFATDSDWTVPASAAITGGKCVFTNSTSEFLTQTMSGSFVIGNTYKTTCSLVVDSGTDYRLPYDGNVANIVTTSTTGEKINTFVAASATSTMYTSFAQASFNGSVDNISAKQFLEADNPFAIGPFETTWETENLGGTGSATKVILLPMTGGDNAVDWGDGTIDYLNTHTYATTGTKTVKVYGDVTGFRFNNGGDKLKLTNVSNVGGLVIDDGSMFYGCANMTWTATDAPTITATVPQQMFRDCTIFNGNINNWDMSNTTSISSIFRGCTAFNQPLNNWDVSGVTIMAALFFTTPSFDQDISSWDVSGVSNAGSMFGGGDGLSTANYDLLLVSMDAQTLVSGVTWNFGTAKYSAGAPAAARASLVGAPDLLTITDGGPA